MLLLRWKSMGHIEIGMGCMWQREILDVRWAEIAVMSDNSSGTIGSGRQ